jgi:lipoprotein signal peptidase
VRSHLLNLVLFSAIVATFFAFLTKNTPRERVRLGLILGGAMVGLSLLLAWIMYPFPLR